VDTRAIIPAADVEEIAITHAEWSTRSIWQVHHIRPGPIVRFVVVNRDAGTLVAARSYDARITYRCSIEPQPVHYHVRTAGPAVSHRIVDLGDRLRGRKSAAEQIQFPLEHRAARRCHCRWHIRTGCPRIGRDIVDVQRV